MRSGDIHIKDNGDHVVVGTLKEIIDVRGGEGLYECYTGEYTSVNERIYHFDDDNEMTSFNEEILLCKRKKIETHFRPGEYKNTFKKMRASKPMRSLVSLLNSSPLFVTSQ